MARQAVQLPVSSDQREPMAGTLPRTGGAADRGAPHETRRDPHPFNPTTDHMTKRQKATPTAQPAAPTGMDPDSARALSARLADMGKTAAAVVQALDLAIVDRLDLAETVRAALLTQARNAAARLVVSLNTDRRSLTQAITPATPQATAQATAKATTHPGETA